MGRGQVKRRWCVWKLGVAGIGEMQNSCQKMKVENKIGKEFC